MPSFCAEVALGVYATLRSTHPFAPLGSAVLGIARQPASDPSPNGPSPIPADRWRMVAQPVEDRPRCGLLIRWQVLEQGAPSWASLAFALEHSGPLRLHAVENFGEPVSLRCAPRFVGLPLPLPLHLPYPLGNARSRVPRKVLGDKILHEHPIVPEPSPGTVSKGAPVLCRGEFLREDFIPNTIRRPLQHLLVTRRLCEFLSHEPIVQQDPTFRAPICRAAPPAPQNGPPDVQSRLSKRGHSVPPCPWKRVCNMHVTR
jgi:hypothetical protein